MARMTVHTAPLPSRSPASLWFIRLAYTVGLVAVMAASLALAGAVFYDLAFRGRIYPGVRAWGVDLSGMRPEEAALALTGAFTYPNNPAFLLSDGQTERTFAPRDLGATFDVGATVLQAYRIGRSGNLLADWQAQYRAWHDGVEIAPVLALDEGRALAALNALAQETYRPAVEASLSARGTEVVATPGQIGRSLDVPQLAAVLRGHLARTEKAAVLLPFVETAPLVLDATPQAEAARRILSRPLTLVIETPAEGDPGPWTVEPAQLAAMLRITRVQDGANAARFDVTLDPAALRAVLEPLAEPLRREARDARFIFNDDTRQLEVIQPALDARTLDVDATVAAINAALPQGRHTVPLVFQVQPPAVTDSATAEQLGITGLVSEQYTSFRGSGAERLQNIQTAAARFHGLLVPPGAVFSFAEAIGDISLDSGFAEALIIYGGRTIRGIGGGVCQVSTTLFRAVWFGGYPVVERNAHAYRVGYYEQPTGSWQGPGLDAAVFTPLVDFKFRNDTPYWLLMETYVNVSAGRLTWKFYSTPDGRQVEVSPARVENVVPAPEPLYEENPELAAGEIKQVDFAADGADVTVTRVITRDGVRINPDEPPLRTHYQPWRAIYQYGPGTEGIPTPTPEATPSPTP